MYRHSGAKKAQDGWLLKIADLFRQTRKCKRNRGIGAGVNDVGTSNWLVIS